VNPAAGSRPWDAWLQACLAKSEGKVRYRGEDIDSMSGAEARRVKLNLQMIFQILSLPESQDGGQGHSTGGPRVHGLVSGAELGEYVDGVMLRVGLDPDLKSRYPHQFFRRTAATDWNCKGLGRKTGIHRL